MGNRWTDASAFRHRCSYCQKCGGLCVAGSISSSACGKVGVLVDRGTGHAVCKDHKEYAAASILKELMSEQSRTSR